MIMLYRCPTEIPKLRCNTLILADLTAQDRLTSTGVHLLRRQVVEALVIALGVVVANELSDARL